jgi:hypothetical protein
MNVWLGLFISSVVSGVVATAVMMVFLYLPRTWGGLHYDTFGAIGSLVLRRVDREARFLGAALLMVGGVLFAFFYGWFALMFLNGTFDAPRYPVFGFDGFFAILGLVAGFGQGMYVTLISTFIITDHHPVPGYRDAVPLIASFFVGHTVYGLIVMSLQSVLLRAWV